MWFFWTSVGEKRSVWLRKTAWTFWVDFLLKSTTEAMVVARSAESFWLVWKSPVLEA